MNDRGSGSVLMLVTAGAATVFAIAGMFGISIVHAYEQGRAAADLAVLAAAAGLQAGQEQAVACGQAQAVAERNGAALVDCNAGIGDVRISVRSQRVPAFVIRARAGFSGGPAPTPAVQ